MGSTFPELFQKRYLKSKGKFLFSWISNDQVKHYSLTKVKELVISINNFFHHHEIEKGDHISIISESRKEWTIFDLACLLTGRVSVPIYPTLTDKETAEIINHSDSKVVIVENEYQLKKLYNFKDSFEKLKLIITLEEVTLPNDFNFKVIDYKSLLKSSEHYTTVDFDQIMKEVSPNDIATIIYTSGTTGVPKGAVLTQQAFSQMLTNIKESIGHYFDYTDKNLIHLPLSHVLGRCDSLLFIPLGIEVVYGSSIESLREDLEIVNPTIFITVPRILEKFKESFEQEFKNNLREKVYKFSKSASKQYFKSIDADKSPSSLEIVQKNIAYNTTFSHLNHLFGSNLRFIVTGGAPLSSEVFDIFRFSNIAILEGYGLTETCGPSTLNPIVKPIANSVGVPLGDVKISFSKDNEICIQSDTLFREYYKENQLSQEAFDDDNWFRTGDIGHLNQEGYLVITDRKKDLIVMSNGKNIAPQKIEKLLNSQPEISQSLVYGDKKSFLTALISIDPKESEIFSNLEYEELDDIGSNDLVQKAVAKAVERVNSRLSDFEQIREYKVVPRPFNKESQLMTPSLKIKRKAVESKYKALIDAMYN